MKTGSDVDAMLTIGVSEWFYAAGLWYNSTLMSCEGKVAVEFVGWARYWVRASLNHTSLWLFYLTS